MVGAAGGVTGVALVDFQMRYLAGASAAVASLIGAHIASVIVNWGEDSHAIVNTLRWCGRTISIDQCVVNGYRILKIAVFLFYILQQSVSAHQKYVDDSTSYLSHLSGFIIGFLIGFVALENRRKRTWEKTFQKVCVLLLNNILVLAVAICILRAERENGRAERDNGKCTHEEEDHIHDVVTGLILGGAYCILCMLVCFRRKRKAVQSFRSAFLTVYGRMTEGGLLARRTSVANQDADSV